VDLLRRRKILRDFLDHHDSAKPHPEFPFSINLYEFNAGVPPFVIFVVCDFPGKRFQMQNLGECMTRHSMTLWEPEKAGFPSGTASWKSCYNCCLQSGSWPSTSRMQMLRLSTGRKMWRLPHVLKPWGFGPAIFASPILDESISWRNSPDGIFDTALVRLLNTGSGDQRQNAMLMIRLARCCTLHHDIV